jgi:hypothetical protein
LSRGTVQRDCRRGGHWLARPGEVGRGRGALIDLEAYRRWRAGESDDDRALRLAAELVLRTWKTHGGLTANLRRHAALVFAVYLESFARTLGHDLDDVPEMRQLLSILAFSDSDPQRRP